MLKSLDIKTSCNSQMIDITSHIKSLIKSEKFSHGSVIIYSPHTTCGITINENADPAVVSDMLKQLDVMVPFRQPFYEHAEGNSAAHVKASLMGCSLQVIVTCGHLELGVWQGIYLCEFDGPRTRRVWVQ